jgi:hypothetical protein
MFIVAARAGGALYAPLRAGYMQMKTVTSG